VDADVVIVGGGVAGLVAARDLAARGARVMLLEAAGRLGGCVAAGVVAGLTIDSGAESFATRTPAVGDLVAELGLAADVVTPAAPGAWVQLPDGAVPLPAAGLLGIPARPWSADVRRAVGIAGAARAALDRVLPVRIGLPPGETSLADVVRARMGRRVLERLVAPVVAGVYSTAAESSDLDTVLPGVRNLLRQTGSLGAAVSLLRSAAPAGSAVASLTGGMHRLVTALADDLAARGVDVRTSAPVEQLHRDRDGRWRLVVTGGGEVVTGQVVLAVPGPVAVHLLDELVPQVQALAGPTADVVLVTLAVEAPALDAAPRGSGVLVAAGTPRVRAKALTHATAKWAWLARAAGPGRHVLRLSYGVSSSATDAGRPPRPTLLAVLRDLGGPTRPGSRRWVRALAGRVRSRVPPWRRGAGPSGRSGAEPPRRLVHREQPVPELEVRELRELARRDAAALLGAPLADAQVIDLAVTRWNGTLPLARPGHRARVEQVQAALATHRGLQACGSWVAGTGLAAVVAQARATAARVRVET
jgi:oxygen-dependent protoporphyrinogen oxidase